jgi:hypothetical protein
MGTHQPLAEPTYRQHVRTHRRSTPKPITLHRRRHPRKHPLTRNRISHLIRLPLVRSTHLRNRQCSKAKPVHALALPPVLQSQARSRTCVTASAPKPSRGVTTSDATIMALIAATTNQPRRAAPPMSYRPLRPQSSPPPQIQDSHRHANGYAGHDQGIDLNDVAHQDHRPDSQRGNITRTCRPLATSERPKTLAAFQFGATWTPTRTPARYDSTRSSLITAPAPSRCRADSTE